MYVNKREVYHIEYLSAPSTTKAANQKKHIRKPMFKKPVCGSTLIIYLSRRDTTA